MNYNCPLCGRLMSKNSGWPEVCVVCNDTEINRWRRGEL